MGLCKKWQTSDGSRPRFFSGMVGVNWTRKKNYYKLKDGTKKRYGKKGGMKTTYGWNVKIQNKKKFKNYNKSSTYSKWFGIKIADRIAIDKFDVGAVARECVLATEHNKQVKTDKRIPIKESKFPVGR